MKHCIIMTAYKDADLINMLIGRYPNDWGVFVHIDKKSPIEVEDINKNAIVIKKRRIFWGSINHVKAVLDLLLLAKEDKRNFDYYHIISGQDINVVSPEMFDVVLGDNKNIYMNTFLLPLKSWTPWGGGYFIYQRKTLAKYCDVRGFSVFAKWNRTLIKWQEKYHLLQRLPEFPLYGGAFYCSLTDEAVNEVFANKMTRKMLKKMRFSTCGEELFFQTILMNSKLKNKVVDNCLRYIRWDVPNPPKVLTTEDYDRMTSGGYLFARKVDKIISRNLIGMLD